MYTEPEKIRCRQASIFKAVKLLTDYRKQAPIADKGYLRRVWEEIRKNGSDLDKEVNEQLSQETISRWETFYESNLSSKKPENLKVAYLCGPNPLNDLEILIEAGVRSENVWAIEADKNLYSEATDTLLTSEYPFVKIVKTDFKTFIEFSNIKFDIIYLDFCGPIFNRGGNTKNLETLTAIAKFHSLNSPGVLITNFALMSVEQDDRGHKLISNLVSKYLYPKEFLEDEESPSLITESMQVYGIYPDKFDEMVAANLSKYYSQFVTRLVKDLFEVIVPSDRLMNNPKMLHLFFDKLEYKNKPRSLLKKAVSSIFNFSKNGGGGDIHVDPSEYSLLWTLFHCIEADELTDTITFKKDIDGFVKQLSGFSINNNDFFQKMSAYYYLKSEDRSLEIFYSDSLKKISSSWRCFGRYIFCDVFLFHQLKDLLIRQLTVPYHLNMSQSQRWKYKAKDTEMYQDLFVFDECRYIYDWMPTIDMLQKNLDNVEIELSYRYVLDALSKHNRWYSNEYFAGCAIISGDVKGFEDIVMKPRETVT